MTCIYQVYSSLKTRMVIYLVIVWYIPGIYHENPNHGDSRGLVNYDIIITEGSRCQ